MDRWLGRRENNIRRFQDLECVKLILPWSTPSLRFCTSEQKAQPIDRELKRHFPFNEILTVTGIRRQESGRRRVMPVSKVTKALTRNGLRGVTWNNVIDGPVEQVFATMERVGLSAHEAYTRFLVSRVSCVFCIMSSEADLHASAACEDNQAVYVEMVELEATSTYAFQEGKWLADVAPHLLSADLTRRVALAKAAAARREAAEARLPTHLLFEKGWPTAIPSRADAALIAEVRAEVAAAVGIRIEPLSADDVIDRYRELMDRRLEKEAEKAAKAAMKAAKLSSKAQRSPSTERPTHAGAARGNPIPVEPASLLN